MEAKFCRSDAQLQVMAYGHEFMRIISPTGQVIAKMEHNAEGALVADIDLELTPPPSRSAPCRDAVFALPLS